jgi:hypothetical protein
MQPAQKAGNTQSEANNFTESIDQAFRKKGSVLHSHLLCLFPRGLQPDHYTGLQTL